MTDHASFTRTAADLVAANDRVPQQRIADQVPPELKAATLEEAAEEIADRWPQAAAYLQGRARGIAGE